jgi:hypothetical protein
MNYWGSAPRLAGVIPGRLTAANAGRKETTGFGKVPVAPARRTGNRAEENYECRTSY